MTYSTIEYIIIVQYIERRVQTVNERIKILREALELSMEKFGAKIGLTRSAISKIESGSKPSDQTVLSICREFNVREEWLRNGNGEMFSNLTEDEFSKAAATFSNDPFVRGLLVEYWKLDEDNKRLFREFIHKLSDNMREQTSKQETEQCFADNKTIKKKSSASTDLTAPVDFSHLTIDEKVALYRQELERERKVEEESEVS